MATAVTPWTRRFWRGRRRAALPPFLHGHKSPFLVAQIELPGAGDLLLRIGEHLLPLSQPAGGAADGEENREHVDRKAHRLVDDARVEIHVRIEFSLDEVLILERDSLELDGYVDLSIPSRHLEDLVGDLLDDLGPRVVALVHAVAEAHQSNLPTLYLFDIGRYVVLEAEFRPQPQHRLGGPPLQR